MQKMPTMPSSRNRPSASKLRHNESGGSAGMLAAALVVVSLVVFTISVSENGSGFFTSMHSVAETVVTPLRLAGSAIVSPFSGLSNVMRNLTADEQSLTDLQRENESLKARNAELEEAQLTAQRLSELLDLRNSYSLQSVAVRVIAGSTDSWSATITIDKGSSSGLAVGMPVVCDKGAVGQILSCSATTSVVRLLSDEDSSISAMVQANRAQGMLEGSLDGTLFLSFIRTDQTINVGDNVVTSGLGGVFPKGLLLGKVSRVESSPGASYYTIVVEPVAQMANLEELLVVTSLTEEQEASAEDIEMADEGDLAAARGTSLSTLSQSGDEAQQDGGSSTKESQTDLDGQDGSSTDSSQAETDTATTGNAAADEQDEGGEYSAG